MRCHISAHLGELFDAPLELLPTNEALLLSNGKNNKQNIMSNQNPNAFVDYKYLGFECDANGQHHLRFLSTLHPKFRDQLCGELVNDDIWVEVKAGFFDAIKTKAKRIWKAL
jgi:hypothetical protein